MTTKRVLITHPVPDAGVNLLKEKGFAVEIFSREQSRDRDLLLARIPEFDGMIALLFNRIDGPLLDAATRLKVVANFAVGYDNIDIPAARTRGVMVTNTPDVLTNATAEVAFALLLNVMRRIGESERFARAGRFKGWDPLMLLGDELAGRSVGILGMGRIGRNMAQKCRAFGMEVRYHNRSRLPAETEAALSATYCSLDELLATSDAISIHTPSTPETRHLFNAERFAVMKEGVYIVNTARGDIIHEAALVDALQSGKVAGAGLDVYEFEPEITAALMTMENVVLLPHIGSASHEARNGMCETAARNVIAVLEGKKPPNPIPELRP